MIRRGGAEGTMRRFHQPIAAALLMCALAITPAGALAPAQDAAPKAAVKAWTLRDCISAALAANLDLSIEALNPEVGAAEIEETKEQYLPQFNLSYYKYDQTQPGSWGVEGTAVQTRNNDYSLILSERIVTGTTAQISFTNSMTDTSRAFTVVNPSYSSSFAFTLTQSLLKGFGPKVNRVPTVQAENRRDMSVSALKAAVLQTVYSVEEAYWSLVSAIENRKVQEASLEQSRALLEKNREAVRIGSKSALDILNSEAEVAQYEDALVSARLNVEQTEARLKLLMNMPSGAAPPEGGAIIPADRPVVEKKPFSAEEALRTALEQRPEMVQSGLEIANHDQSITSFRNQLLPQLDLTLQAWSPGQSGVLYLYDNGNPLTGNLIGKVEGSRAEALKLIGPLALALRYARRLLDTPVPNDVLSRSASDLNPLAWPWRDALFIGGLLTAHPSCRLAYSGMAEFMLYIRSHALRMPIHLLMPHLLHKAWTSMRGEKGET